MINWKTIAFYFMIFVIVVLSVYVIFFFHTQGYKCMANSGVYFIDSVNKANNGDTSCSCFIIRNGTYADFNLDKKGIHTSLSQININTSTTNSN